MESEDFFELEWNEAIAYMERCPRRELEAFLAFAHGYIEQNKKGVC